MSLAVRVGGDGKLSYQDWTGTKYTCGGEWFYQPGWEDPSITTCEFCGAELPEEEVNQSTGKVWRKVAYCGECHYGEPVCDSCALYVIQSRNSGNPLHHATWLPLCPACGGKALCTHGMSNQHVACYIKQHNYTGVGSYHDPNRGLKHLCCK